ncbi:MAG: ATP-binding protein [Lachnoclostridium sp.]|nr:ATP-binding protein [Lachnospira sp.]MCM1248522.1 ATP-binding protein [Lachnoclostridium sp.]MCM1535316.1 ATP-binding protein [Clostridium sp.]
MENNTRNDLKGMLKLERTVLLIYSFYSVAMFVVACFSDWHLIVKELIWVTTIASWIVHFRQYRSYTFRAEFISVMAWTNICLYALHTNGFSSLLSSVACLVVLLGIFRLVQVIYIGVAASTFIFIYHGLIAKTVTLESATNIIGLFLQILSIYMVSFITWLLIRTQRETSDQLLENIQELKLAEQSKDDFLVNISHEIRTPINAVCGMSEAILQEDLPTNVRGDIIDIQTAGRNLLSTVSNILDFSELESGHLDLVEESYNITSTITDIINMALTFENGKNLEMIVDCDADLPSNLLGDEQKFRRIVLNILENAIKFTKEGGVILRIKSRKEEYGINLIVSIKDSGIGMSRADMEKIFASFSQINARRNREEGGVGLGLAIAQQLVQGMGGFITVTSAPGVGSEFQFTIPQKVLDTTPIVSIRNRQSIAAICYINMEKYNYSVVREGYESSLRHIGEQFGVMFKICKNLAELKHRTGQDNYTHVFIGWEEYREDRKYFDRLAMDLTVVLILDYGQEALTGAHMYRIYKPFTVLSIAAVFNGQKVIQKEEPKAGLKQRFIAPKAKVLVVDDNAMNLKVMARLLLPYQIKVSMAGGGQEALEKLDTMDFDCVFLDHMMPEMDGVETLHKIRQKPGTYFQSLSIIAFTANAIGGAREMFLSEGFDDFIAKPIELSVLERMLRRYIPVAKQIPVDDAVLDNTDSTDNSVVSVEENISPSPQPEANSGQAQSSDTDGLAALRKAGIDLEQGFSYCGDKEGFRDIAGIYHTEGKKRRKQLEQLFKDNDWKNYVITVHALKSNSKGIGANEVAELALNLEMAGKEGRTDYILEHHDELMEKHDMLLKALAQNSFLYPAGSADDDIDNGESEKAEAQTPEVLEEIDPSSLEQQIKQLREKLGSFESEGLDELLDYLAGYEYHDASLKTLTDQLKEKTAEFDFLGASEILDFWEEENHV